MTAVARAIDERPPLARRPLPTLRVRVASGFWQRLRGLIGAAPLGEHDALLIVPCSSVHTWWMTVPIDVVFIDARGCAMKIVERLPPWRVVSCRGARGVIELRADAALPLGLKAGTAHPTVRFLMQAR